MPTITQAFVQQWDTAIRVEASQKESRLASAVTDRGSITGESFTINFLGDDGSLLDANNVRHGDTEWSLANHSTPIVNMADFYKAFPLDRNDIPKMLVNPVTGGDYMGLLMSAKNRRIDDIIYRAARASQLKKDGTTEALPAGQKIAVAATGFTKTKLIEAKKIFRANEADEFANEELSIVYDSLMLEDIQQIEPVDTSSVQNLMATMARRVDQASLTRQQIGTAVSPLLNQEAEKVGQMINNLPVEQRATAISELAQVAGPEQAAALARQIAPKDKALGIALGMAGSMTTQGRHTSEIVLRGAQAMKDKAVKTDNAAVTGIRARVAEEIGNAYPTEDARETMIDAAVFAEYGLQSEGSGDLSRAVRLVTGGGIVERGGQKVPLPQGMTPKQFDERLRTLTPKDLRTDTVVIGGQTIPAKDFLQQVPDAALVMRGNGRYAVRAAGSFVLRPDGKALIVEVR